MDKPLKPNKEASIFMRFALLALALLIVGFILKLIFY